MVRTGPQPVVRLRLRRRGDQWSIEKQIRVDAMTIAPSYPLPATHGRALTGAWCEATDSSGAVIYRKLLPHVADGSVEVPGESGGLQRADVDPGDDELDVVIPDVPSLHTLNVYLAGPRSGDVVATPAQARTPVASLRLRRGGKRDRS